MPLKCDRVYRYRFEVSSMKERNKELPKIGFGLVSKKLIDYSKRKQKEYPTWIDIANRYNVYWFVHMSLSFFLFHVFLFCFLNYWCFEICVGFMELVWYIMQNYIKMHLVKQQDNIFMLVI